MIPMPLGLDYPVWVDDPDLEVRSHVHRVRAPAPGSERVLADLVADRASESLPVGGEGTKPDPGIASATGS